MSIAGDSPPAGDMEETPVENEPGETTVASVDVPAGEAGEAAAADPPANRSDQAEVIVGKIPDVHDLAHMLWTARCTEHGLLGHFESKDEAEHAKAAHLESEHR
jgi:hypothetical protein